MPQGQRPSPCPEGVTAKIEKLRIRVRFSPFTGPGPLISKAWAMLLRKMSVQKILGLLKRGKVTSPRLVPLGSNYTFLVDVTGDGDARCTAVYKPQKGEMPLWDFPPGTLHKREYAAYLVGEALGWHFVPPTVIREGPHGVGSLQLYIDHDPRQNYFTLRDRYVPELKRICLFDCLANNADRKASHCLLGPDGHIWGIDHGLTFHSAPKLRTVIWDFHEEPIPPDLLKDMEQLLNSLRNGSDAEAHLLEVLAPQEVEALLTRLESLLQNPVFPPPPSSRRSVPWPSV